METTKKVQLQRIANHVRQGVIEGVYHAKSGHPGGSLSIADTLTYLYYNEMKVDPANPKWEERDRLVLSKGHCCPALYSVLAEKGYFDKSELKSLRHVGAMLQGHPDMKHIPGVDMSSGSLGQGISAACGIALAGKLKKADWRVFTILGDGEIEEGQVWEAAMYASHYKLDNLCIFVDLNGLQIDGSTAEVMNSSPLDKKFEAFGWHVISVNGHDFDELRVAFKEAKETKGQPTAIIAHTVKGKGVSFMENQAGWHGKAPNAEETKQALAELEASL